MKILVLCQRRKSILHRKKVKNINLLIDLYLNKIFPNESKEYTFMTPGLFNKPDKDWADVKMSFNMIKNKTLQWVEIHKSLFDVILLNTCPLPWFSPLDFYGLAQVLKPRGVLLMGSIMSADPDIIRQNDTLSVIQNNLGLFNPPAHLKYPFRKKRNIPISSLALQELNILFVLETDDSLSIPLLRKRGKRIDAWVPIIRWACESSHKVETRFKGVLYMMPELLRHFTYDAAIYCKQNDKGNSQVVNLILQNQI